MKKTIIAILIASVIGIGGFVGYKYVYSKPASNNQTVRYTTANASKATIEKKITSSGTVDTSSRETITSATVDTIKEVLVKPNDKVKKGQNLITYWNGSAAVIAPYDCIISEVNVKPDGVVKSGMELIKIFDSENLSTKIQVDESELSLIQIGQSADIKLTAYPDEKFTGKVIDINQEGKNSNGVTTFEVTVKLDEIKSIKVGMTAEVSILINRKENVLAIPIEAVRKSKDSKVVMVAGDNNTPVVKKVETGIANNTLVEITSGLDEGDKIEIPVPVQSTQNSQNSNNKNNGSMLMPGMGQQKINSGGYNNRTGGQSPRN